MEKTCPGYRDGSLAYPSYGGEANVSQISLQSVANRLHEKLKVGSAALEG